MGFFSSLWGKNSENGKNTQNNTPTVQQPRMTEAQRHDAFVQSLRENTANGKYGPVPTQSTARKAATGSSEDGGRDRGDDPGAPGSQGRESGLKFGTSKSVSASQGSGKGRGAGLGQGGGRSGGGHGPGGHGGHGSGGLVCSVRQTCFNRKGETTMFESALGNLCIVICGMTVLLSAFFIWRTETLPNRLIVAAAAALVLIFRWQISMMIYQFVASIFTLVALFVGVVLLCALPFVLIRLFLH